MSEKEKIKLLEEKIYGGDSGEATLSKTTRLKEIPEYDSIVKIMIVQMLISQFGATVTYENVKEWSTVQDILDIME